MHLCVWTSVCASTVSASAVCVLPADCYSSVVYSSLWIARVYMLKGYINHWTGVKIDRLGRIQMCLTTLDAFGRCLRGEKKDE